MRQFLRPSTWLVETPSTSLRRLAAGALAGLGFVWIGASAQPADSGFRPNSRELAVGDSLPDLTIWRANGEPFPLRTLRGSHSVIVFGCLT